MTSPLDDIENKQGQKDTGVMMVRIYQGAYEESQSRKDAFWTTVAWMTAMLKAGQDEGEV